METVKQEPKDKATAQSFWELVRFIVIVLAVVIPIRLFIAEPFIVSGSSMVPTFEDKNYLIIDKISYKLKDPKRGDVIVFRYPNDQTKFFIKRIIGLPSETIDIEDGIVTIVNSQHKEGFVLSEPYLQTISKKAAHFELKDDEYFVMGDNRNGSSDSRYWGAVKRKIVIGRVFLRLLPINEIDISPGKYEQLN